MHLFDNPNDAKMYLKNSSDKNGIYSNAILISPNKNCLILKILSLPYLDTN